MTQDLAHISTCEEQPQLKRQQSRYTLLAVHSSREVARVLNQSYRTKKTSTVYIHWVRRIRHQVEMRTPHPVVLQAEKAPRDRVNQTLGTNRTAQYPWVTSMHCSERPFRLGIG
jgi:hypothetical protein